MALIQFGSESHVSKPVKRMRWATQRAPGQSGVRKRLSILNRQQKRTTSLEEKQNTRSNENGAIMPGVEELVESVSTSRTIYMNVPLPDEAKDEEGHPKEMFGRNKIRTTKYTPLSFLPKNLYYQFHNIANVYFFFIIILSVCHLSLPLLNFVTNLHPRSFLFLAPRIPVSVQSL